MPVLRFHSHALKGEVPHDDYVQHLLNVWTMMWLTLRAVKCRQSLLAWYAEPAFRPGDANAAGRRAWRLPLAADAEITMEANPGTVEPIALSIISVLV